MSQRSRARTHVSRSTGRALGTPPISTTEVAFAKFAFGGRSDGLVVVAGPRPV